MKTNWAFRSLIVVSALSMVLSSCGGGSILVPTETPSSALEPTLAAQPTPAVSPTPALAQMLAEAPEGLEVSVLRPETSTDAPLEGPVELQFDRPVDSAKVEGAFELIQGEKAVPGKFSWPSPDRMVFQPTERLEPGVDYEARLVEGAAGTDGATLAQPFSFRFSTLAPLAVSQVFPADGAQEVDPDGQVTVMFTRPVVPLEVGAGQADLPAPLSFSPVVEGSGEWVSTSVYVFKPAKALKAGIEYSLSVAAGLKDASGDTATALAKEFSVRFTTRAPGILQLETEDRTYNAVELEAGSGISPLPKIKVYFLQAMDPASTARAIVIAGPETQPIPFSLQWDKEYKVATVRPQRYLLNGTSYSLTVGAQALSADGGSLGKDLTWNFTTAAPAGILSTSPKAGEVSSDFRFQIHFASRMKRDTISDRVVFDPPLEHQDWWYNDYDRVAEFYGLKPSTKYRVTLLPGMLSRWDQAINTRTTVEFTTAALSPMAYLNMPYAAVFRADAPQNVYVSFTNVQKATLRLYKTTVEDFIHYDDRGFSSEEELPFVAPENLVWERETSFEAALDKPGQKEISLAKEGEKTLKPGIYFLLMDSPEVKHSGRFVDIRSLVVTETYLVVKNAPGDALLWTIDPQSGKPVADVPLKIVEPVINPPSASKKGGGNVAPPELKVLGQGTTDKDGLLHLDLPVNEDQGYTARYAFTDGDGPFTIASIRWSADVDSDTFGIQRDYSGQLYKATAYIYTDRPLYRPGQPVYYKGVVRIDNDLAYRLTKEEELEVTINSYDKEISRQTVKLSSYGTFDGKLDLPPEAALGSYFITARIPGQTKDLGNIYFTVAEYRKPEFQFDLQAEPVNLLIGDTLNSQLAASYYSGGPLVKAQVDWTLRSDPFFYTPPVKYGRYSFYDDSRDSGPQAYRPQEEYGKLIAEGNGVTDDEGRLKITVPTVAQSAAGSRSLTLEASVTDFSGNSVAGQAQAVAHKAYVYAGVRPNVYVGKAGEELAFEMVALDWAGKPVAGSRMDVEISERQWYSVQQEDATGVLRWVSSVKDVPVKKVTRIETDDEGLASVPFIPERGGVYRALVTVYDEKGNQNRAAAYIWVAGTAYIPWRQNDDRTFQLVADQDSYKPGDTASLLIASPYQGTAYALVTVERGRVRSQEVIRLEGNSTVYKLPVTDDMAPVVYASVMIVKGVDETNPRPSYKIGMARLNVASDRQFLQVKVKPDREEAHPGEKVTYTVETLGADGKGAAAEVSLGLSDLATLSLMPSNSRPLKDYFYSERGLAVSTGITIAVSMEDYNENLRKQVAEGVSAGSGGGKGGEGVPGVPAVRQNFPDTAFWEAHLVTADDGKATVTVTLPDNLTTWRMDARAITLDSRVGQTQVDLVSSKALLVRPQTPRFFVAGDRAVVGAAVHNNTGESLKTSVTLEAEGARLESSAGQRVEIAAGQQALVTWKVTIPADSQRVDLVFKAEGGAYQDASRPTAGTLDNQGIPVYRYEAPETAGTSGILAAEGSRTETVRLPAGMDVTAGGLTVSLEPSLAAGMAAGLRYLESYPYECAEQTVSRFLPNVLSLRALRAAGLSDPALEEKLKDQVSTGLQRLYNRQNADGGWGWWENETSDPMTSAYVTLALVEVRRADFTVDAAVLENALNFLKSVTVSADLQSNRGRNRQAFLLYVLARAGLPDVSQSVRLYDSRAGLDLFGRGFLGQALAIANPADERLKAITSDLAGAAVLSAAGAHWEEKEDDPWNWNTNTRSTAILLSTLIRLDPQNELLPSVVRWLMVARTDGRWKSTQETAWTLMALTDWLEATGELKAHYAFAAALNGKELGSGQVEAESLQKVTTLTTEVADLLRGEANRLVIARTAGPGSLYYTAYLKAALPVDEVQPLNKGIMVSRRYYQPDDLKTPVVKAAQGEILQVRLTLVVPQDLHYALVTDPLPAGLEAVDSQLRSSPQFDQYFTFDWARYDQEGWGWWYFSHAELRDEKVVLSASYLPAGTYTYTYRVRASTPGIFNVIPPSAEEFYFPDVSGRGAGSTFEVTP